MKTALGTSALQIVHPSHPRLRDSSRIASAHDDAELEVRRQSTASAGLPVKAS